MIFLLFTLSLFQVSESPRIDGNIEPIWKKTEPVTGFIQMTPDRGQPATQPTEVYILGDRKNLYVLFHCKSPDVKPAVKVTGWDECDGDWVTVYLDTYGDKNTCYLFQVSSAGAQADAVVTRGGRSEDFSYDGIWEANTRVYTDEWIAEIKIPYKSIRYKKGDWNIQLSRCIEKKAEMVYYKEVDEMKGIRIENFAPLQGVNPQVEGKFLEFYPVGAVRYDSDVDGLAGLDASWDPSSNTSLDLTVNPDYAQIEADPFQVNLSQYALYLQEKRPFFLEGKEMFNLPRGSGFFIGPGPYEFFYSRNIGRVINDTTKIPIRVGTKATVRKKEFEGGMLYADTGQVQNEESANYFVSRFIGKLPVGFSPGFIYEGKYTNSGNIQLTGLDGSWDFGSQSILYQFAFADSMGIRDKASFLAWTRVTRKMIINVSVNQVGEDFDIGELGYIDLRGVKLSSGFSRSYFREKSQLRRISLGGYSFISKKPWTEDYTRRLIGSIGLSLRNNLALSFTLGGGKKFVDPSRSKEEGSDISFFRKYIKLYVDSYYGEKFNFYLSTQLIYDYNYYTMHPGYQTSNYIYLSFIPSKNFKLNTLFSMTGYWEEQADFLDVFSTEKMEDTYLVISPEIEYYLSPSLSAEIRTEFTYQWSESKFIQTRVNPLLKWMIAPKSWLYLVYSKRMSGEEKLFENHGSSMIKLRYLFNF